MFVRAMDHVTSDKNLQRPMVESTESAAITTTTGAAAAAATTSTSYTSMHIDRSYSAEDVLIQATIVDTAELLRQAGARLRICHQIAFDLEMHSFRSYHGVTCLIQIAGGGVNYLVDPLGEYTSIFPLTHSLTHPSHVPLIPLTHPLTHPLHVPLIPLTHPSHHNPLSLPLPSQPLQPSPWPLETHTRSTRSHL